MLVLSSFWELFKVLVIKFLKNLFYSFVFAIAEQQLYLFLVLMNLWNKMDNDNDLLNVGDNAALLCVDLQKCYYRPPITQLFPKLEENATKVLDVSRYLKWLIWMQILKNYLNERCQGLPVIHVRQEDKWGQSPWLPWWSSLHPGQEKNLGVPEPLDCARNKDQEPVFIKNTFDGFFRTGLHEHLQ